MSSISRRSAVVVMGVAVCLSLGIVIALSSNWLSGEGFSAYQRAKIDRRAEPGTVGASVISLGAEQDLDFVQLSNPRVGWVGNHYGLLYATEDAGKTWQRRDLNLGVGVNGTYFTDMYFGSDSLGWAIAQRYNKPGQDICMREGSLIRTSDRGQTWQLQFTKKCVELIKITFAGESEGWVLGRQFVQHKESTEGRFLVMHTSDGGSTWVDVSDGPNRLMMESSGRMLELPAGFAATGNGSATLITGNGYLLDASNGGWRRSGSLALYSLLPEAKAMSDRSVTVNAGVDGVHGTAGMVARRDDKGRWTGSWFTDFLLKDAVFLSKNEIVACGSLLPENPDLQERSKRQGAILFSRDGGLDWKPVYLSTDIKAINALHVSEREIWAVGSKGHIIQISLP